MKVLKSHWLWECSPREIQNSCGKYGQMGNVLHGIIYVKSNNLNLKIIKFIHTY